LEAMMELNKLVNTISKKENYQYVPKEFKKIANSMEQQFMEHMLQQMEKTTGEKTESTADSYYKGLQRSERAEIFSQLSGKGSLKDLILEQIYPEKYRNELSYNAFVKSQEQKLDAYQKVSKGNLR
jgi:Rod binding domain-containing protein